MKEDSYKGCSACHAQFLCGRREEDREQACSLPVSLAHKAVRISYVYPILLFLAVLCGVSAAGLAEGWAALCAFAVLGLYYMVLRLMRAKWEKLFTNKSL